MHTWRVSHLAFNFQRRSAITEKGRVKLTSFKSFPDCIMTLGWLGCLVRKKPLKKVPGKNLAKYLWWKSLFFRKFSGWMSAALLKLNFFSDIYFAMTACYLSFYFQNIRTVFLRDSSQLLLPCVYSYFTKLNWTCINTVLFPLCIYIYIY